MAVKISNLTALTSAAADDVLPIVDTSTGVTKKITVANLLADVEPVVATYTSASTITPGSNTDKVLVTALAANLTINNVSGTPEDGHLLIFRIKDNGTGRSLTWGSGYRAVGVSMPGSTTANKMLYVQAAWNTADSKYDVISVGREA